MTPQVWALQITTDHNTITGHHREHRRIGKAFKTIGIPNKFLPFWKDTEVECGKPKCRHKARAHRYFPQIHVQKNSEVYKRIVQGLKNATKENSRLKKVKTRIEQEIKVVKDEIERSKRGIPRIISKLNSLSLSPNYAGYVWSALDALDMRKEQLLSRHDPGNELVVINEGIQAFEAQLDLIQVNEAGRVVETFVEDAG
ncbi:hypothetical protein B0J17DRAFT_633447 [Rhizoctonia solani]|nr:hypothetical protein B0J17DRAFT_633447 [Rhizoctonia solani]